MIINPRVRGVLALAAVALLAGACSVSIEDAPATEAGDGGSSDGSEDAAASGPDFSGARLQGVTDDTLTLGVAALDTQLIKDTYGVDIGNIPKEGLPALVEATNDAGGINGRQVELKVRYFMPIGNEPSETACRELIEDEQVFAVLGSMLGDNPLCITETYSIPYIGLWGLNTERHQRSLAPFVTAAAEEEEGLQDSIEVLVDSGEIDGAKVGIYYEPGTTEAAIQERVVAPLEDAGIEVVSSGQLQQTNDAIVAGQEIDRILQRFEADGADTVILASGAGVVMPALERTSWAPQLVFVNNGQILGQDAVIKYGSTDPSELEGAIGAVNGLTSAEKAQDEKLAECFATISERSDLDITADDVYTEEERPGSQEMALLGEVCLMWEFAVEVLTAAGDEPTPQSLLDGLATLDDFDLQFNPGMSLSPTRWGAKEGSRLWSFDADGVAFVPVDADEDADADRDGS